MKKKALITTVLSESFYKSRYELILELIELDYEIILVGPEKFSTIKKFFLEFPVKYYQVDFNRTNTNIFEDIKTINKLSKIIYKEQPHLTYAFGGAKSAIYTTIASSKNNVPLNFCMVNGLGSVFRGTGIKNIFIKNIMSSLYKYALSKSTGVLFQNKDDLQFFLDKKLVNASKCQIVNGSGVNLGKFNYFEPQNDRVVFLFVGRLLRDKGIYEFIESAKLVKNSGYSADFWIVGGVDDNPTSVSKSEIRNWEKQKIIKYFGRQEEIITFYQESSVFVLPSYHEGTPRTSLEAMAVGRPIITTEAPGCRETVVDKQNGFLVPISSSKEISDKMIYFIENQQEIIKMGIESNKIAKQKYDVKKVNSSIIEFFGI